MRLEQGPKGVSLVVGRPRGWHPRVGTEQISRRGDQWLSRMDGNSRRERHKNNLLQVDQARGTGVAGGRGVALPYGTRTDRHVTGFGRKSIQSSAIK